MKASLVYKKMMTLSKNNDKIYFSHLVMTNVYQKVETAQHEFWPNYP